MPTIIVEPTEACNARCAYCYVVTRESRATKTMSLETLDLLFFRIDEYLAARPKEFMGLVWHGGEPLILGVEWFEAALGFQKQHCPTTTSRIRHAIQSNLTLLTLDFVRIFKKLGITTVGSSYDPFSNLRRLGEARDAAEYNRRYRDGVELLKREGMGCGIAYVVTRLSLNRPLEIFSHLLGFGVSGPIDFNPVRIYGEDFSDLKITAGEYADFLGAIFPVWWRDRAGLPDIGPFTPLVRNLLDGDRRVYCRDSGRCAQVYLNLEPDGRLSHCNRLSNADVVDYGTIHDRTLAEALADPKRNLLLERNRVLFEGECQGCRFWNICHGGCPADSWYENGSLLHKSSLCDARKGFVEKYVEPTILDGLRSQGGGLPD